MLVRLALLVALTVPAVALPSDVFVDAQADCALADGTAALPFCTVQEALAVAAPMDRVVIAPGTYPEQLFVTMDVVLMGAGGRDATVLDGTGLSSCVSVSSGATVHIEGLTLSGASARGLNVSGDVLLFDARVSDCQGGGIAVTGSGSSLYAERTVVERNQSGCDFGAGIRVDAGVSFAELIECQVQGNIQGCECGGIYSESDLTLRRCTVQGNSAGISGGGLMAFNGDLVIDSCLFTDNEAFAFGGGVYARNLATLTVINTTISGNRVDPGFGSGGGAYIDDNSAGFLGHCTVTENVAAEGGGFLFLRSPAVSIAATILSGNIASVGPADFQGGAGGAVSSAGENVMGDATFFSAAPTDAVATDPMLAPLAYNGGLTQTHAPLSGSPCVGLAFSGLLAEDQRGAARRGVSLESGAFELISAPSFCPGVQGSTLRVAGLHASGDQVASSGVFSLHASELPTGSFAFFLVGDGTQVTTPVGSMGVLCVGGTIGRFNRFALNEIRVVDDAGTASLDVDLAAVPTANGTAALVAGDTRYFQLWYRDLNPTPTSNFTTAIGVTFE